MRLLSKTDIDYIALGAAILASGGGGDPYIGKVMALNALKEYGPITLLSVDELEPEALIVSTGTIGASMVSFEKLPNGQEAIIACRLIEENCQQIEKYRGKKISAIYPLEVGGINSLWPLAIASRLGLPVVDFDGMGRAFPQYHMTTLSLDDISASPFVIVDAKSSIGLVHGTDNHTTENLARAMCAEMGSTAFHASYPITPSDAKKSGILGTLGLAQRIGEMLEQARKTKTDVVQVLLSLLQGFVLFRGKITRIEQQTNRGFTHGSVYFSGVDTDKGKEFEVLFQNEYLLAQGASRLLCTTPDLIILLDENTGIPILTERLRYGARVVVLGVPANKKWRTPRGIKVAGPRYFNYDADFTPVEILAATNKDY